MSGTAIAPRIEGLGAVDVTPEGGISVPGAPQLITPFRMIPVGAATTASQVFVDLLVVPDVAVAIAGDLLIDFDASIQAVYTAGSAATLGAMFQFLWDGLARPEQAFFEIDPAFVAPNLDSISGNPRLRAIIPAALAAPGVHDLRVQWAVLAADEQAEAFADNGNLSIQSRPS